MVVDRFGKWRKVTDAVSHEPEWCRYFFGVDAGLCVRLGIPGIPQVTEPASLELNRNCIGEIRRAVRVSIPRFIAVSEH